MGFGCRTRSAGCGSRKRWRVMRHGYLPASRICSVCARQQSLNASRGSEVRSQFARKPKTIPKTVSRMLPTQVNLEEVFRQKHGPNCGWGPRLRARFGYFTPDDVYESCVSNHVSGETEWLDVGGGRGLFPDNETAARILSERCRRLVGVDPSDNI